MAINENIDKEESMIHSELLKQIDRFVGLAREFFPDLVIMHSDAYHVGKNWDSDQIPFADDNGIYFLCSTENMILYIGKSEQTDGGGIGRRVWSAVKEGIKSKLSDIDLDDKLEKEILEGNFYIFTSKVSPGYYSCLLEIFALTVCCNKDGELPIFNKEIC